MSRRDEVFVDRYIITAQGGTAYASTGFWWRHFTSAGIVYAVLEAGDSGVTIHELTHLLQESVYAIESALNEAVIAGHVVKIGA